MATTPTALNDLFQAALEAYLQAVGKWAGCDWPVQLGSRTGNLQGLTATQAQLLARATAGQEAAQWRAACSWLGYLEEQAEEAEAEAAAAVALARGGQWREALGRAERAVAIEAAYHQQLVWQPLREAIQAGLAAGPAREG
jgi:hypothetical protein